MQDECSCGYVGCGSTTYPPLPLKSINMTQQELKNRIEELKEKCESYPAHQYWSCESEKVIARLEQLYDDLYGK